jgi:hypothetical protein
MLFMWAYLSAETILADVRALNPHALLLLAYFGVLFKVVESSFWFIEGWGKQLVADIDMRLSGYRELGGLMKWPRERALG